MFPSKHRPNELSSPKSTSPIPVRRPGVRAAFAIVAIALAAVALAVPAGALGATPPAAPAPLATPTGTWAWGALENATYEATSIGAYSDVLNLSSGNLTGAVGAVAEVQNLHAEYGAFALVNATAPNSSSRFVEAEAVSVANVTGVVAVGGDLPAAGTYAPGAAIHLVNQTGLYLVAIREVSAEVAFANLTSSNGSLALVNEHVETWTGVNLTAVAYHWPAATADANGSTTVAYSTVASVQLGWVAVDVAIRFSPALPIAETPLFVGEQWNATTTASVNGWAAYATASAVNNGTTNVSAFNTGAVSLNTTAPLTFGFAVVGSETVLFPNGTSETGYTVVASPAGGTSGTYVLWDGLLVLPASPTPSGQALRPATPVALAAQPSVATGPSTSAVLTEGGLPVSSPAAVGTTATLGTAPVDPGTARSAIGSTETPSQPKSPAAPTITGSPPGGSPLGSGPGGTPASPGGAGPSRAGSSGGVDPFLLVAVLALLGLVLLGVELVRERRQR